jgi:hypothetical protein
MPPRQRNPKGVDDVWGGTEDRNWYYGTGIEINMHVGKNVIYVEGQSNVHRGPAYDALRATQITLGWRVASIVFGE